MWVKEKPEYGDQIRVSRGLYYHHGIYQDDDCVYQFAVPGEERDIDPDLARVTTTTLEGFLRGGELEVRRYTEEEKKKKRSPLEIVQYAKDHLGEAGYNLLTNNCEHFSNRCVFDEPQRTQVDDVFKRILEVFR